MFSILIVSLLLVCSISGNILQVTPSQNSVTVEFLPVPGVLKYQIDVYLNGESTLAESTTLSFENVPSLPIQGTVGNLKSGTRYEIVVSHKDNSLGASDYFFTDCEDRFLQCVTGYLGDYELQDCLGPESMCNGIEECVDGYDEEEDEEGFCVNVLPESDEVKNAGIRSSQLDDTTNNLLDPVSCIYRNKEQVCICKHPSTGEEIDSASDFDATFYLNCLSLRDELTRLQLE